MELSICCNIIVVLFLPILRQSHAQESCKFLFAENDNNVNGYFSASVFDSHPINQSVVSVAYEPSYAKPNISQIGGTLNVKYYYSDKFTVDNSEPGRVKLVSNDSLALPLYPFQLDSVRLTFTMNCLGTRYSFVSLTIDHVNSYAPWFYRQPYNISVPESTKIGYLIDTPILAMDWDPSVTYDVVFKIESGDPDGYFELVIDKNALRAPPRPPIENVYQFSPIQMPYYLQLRLLKPLDYDNDGIRTFQLNISATDDDSVVPRNNWTHLLINIADSDDLRPMFRKNVYKGVVNPEWPIGHALEFDAAISAVDGDRFLQAPIIYSIDLPTEDSSFFQINPSDGVISILKVLSPTKKLYEFDINATQVDNAAQYNSARVQLTVPGSGPQPSGPPEFTSCSFEFTIRENSVDGTNVGRLTIKPRSGDVVFDKDNSTDSSAFQLDTDTGILSVALGALLDRESQDTYTFEVQVHSPAFVQPTAISNNPECFEATVVVTLLDENDNTPQFTQRIYKFTITDAIKNNNLVGVVKATDPDAGDAGVVVYDRNIPNLASGEESEVSFQGVPMEDGTMEILIEFTTAGKPKLQPFYRLTVIARDKDQVGQREGAASVEVTVKFTNSHLPIFEQAEYSVSINEHLSAGQSVVTVTATDQDEGESGRFSYVLDSDVFSINPETGEISVKDPTKLDRETVDSFKMKVTTKPFLNNTEISSDSGPTTANIEVTLIDINDNNPVFYDQDGNITKIYKFQIDSSTNIDEYIGKVQARDEDLDLNGQVQLIPFLVSDLFRLASDGSITVAKTLPRLTDVYNLVIQAKDSPDQFETRSAFATVIITVLYTERSAPQFLNLPKTAAVSESAVEGTPVFYLSAIDPDAAFGSSQDETVQFSIISGNDAQYFDLSGPAVVVSNPLDAEVAKDFALVMSVQSKTDLSKSNNSTLTIEVLDANDFAPIFEQAIYGFIVNSEQLSTGPGTEIGKVKAVDGDLSQTNNIVTYSLDFTTASDVNAVDIFEIDPASGTMGFKSIPDDIRRSYFFSVVAMDSGTPKYQASVRVTVTLDDGVTGRPEPPNPVSQTPTCTQIQYAVQVLEGGTIPRSVMRVTCYHDSRVVSYQLITPSDVSIGMFSIDSDGTIFTNEPFNFNRRSVYNMTVKACLDPNIENSCRSAPIIIRIIDVNDNAPKFNRTVYSLTLPANLSIDSFVIGIKATDADSSEAGEIHYSLRPSAASDYFVIDENTGEIRTKKLLDISRFSLQIEAFDNGVPRLSSLANLNINVSGISKETPVFIKSFYVFDVDENNIFGYNIGNVQAVNPDSGLSQDIYYSLGSDIDLPVALDGNTGQLTISQSINYENQNIFEFEIRAQDQSSSQQNFGTTAVRIRVRDLNDAAKFRPLHQTIFLPRTIQPGTKLLKLFYTDEDVKPEWKVNELGIIDTGGFFEIQEDYLSVKKVLDREDYMFSLIVRDTQDPSLSSEHDMKVISLNDREQYPVFPQLNYEFSIPYTLPAVVHQFEAVVSEGTPVYKIIEGTTENSSITLTTDGALTAFPILRDQLSENDPMFLVVRAENPSNPTTFYSDVVVTLTTGKLTFPALSYSTTILENVTIGKKVDVNVAIGPINMEILYEISPSDIFSIQSNGEILVNHALDLESMNVDTDGVYKATIFATNGQTTASTRLLITIMDVNEYAPVFETDTYVLTIPDTVLPGDLITKISATDSDFSDTMTALRYEIKEGTPEGIIEVNSNGDILRPTYPATDLKYNFTYDIVVVVLDNAGLTDETTFHVTYQGKSTDQLIFTKPLYMWGLYEGLKGVDEKLRVEVNNGDVQFSIIQGNIAGGFSIEPIGINTANLISRSPIDRELRHKILMTIEARSKSDPTQFALASVEISVLDVNDNPPIFKQRLFSKQIPADFPVGFSILRIDATDADINSTLMYSVIDDRANNLFILGSMTGEMELSRPCPLKNETYRLTVLVSDGVYEDTCDVAISVYMNPVHCDKDGCSVNNGTEPSPGVVPKFTQNSYNFSVPENQAGVLVGRLSIENPALSIDYSIETPTYKNLFRIDQSLGELYTKEKIKYEPIKEEISFLVLARDRDSGRIAFVPVFIEINDENDNSPTFLKSQYVASLPYFAVIGDTIDVDAQATDNDKGINAQLLYSLTGKDASCFSIDTVTAVVKLECAIDGTHHSPYQFKITATDLNGAGNSNSVPVTIFVTPAPGQSTKFVTFPGGNTGSTNTNTLFSTDQSGSTNSNRPRPTGNPTSPGQTKTNGPMSTSNTGSSGSTASNGPLPTGNPTSTGSIKTNGPILTANPSATGSTNTNGPVQTGNPIGTGTNPTIPTITNTIKFPSSSRGPNELTVSSGYKTDGTSKTRTSFVTFPTSHPTGSVPSHSCTLLFDAPYQEIALIPTRLRLGISLYAATAKAEGQCYGGITYGLTGFGTEYFSIGQSTGVFKISSAINMTQLSLDNRVELIEPDVYGFNMSVSATESNADTVYQILIIRLFESKDINDGRLKFSDGFYTFLVDEEQPNGTTIGTVNAASANNPNDPVVFSVQYEPMFFMDPREPGRIYLIGYLDRDLPNGDEYIFVVKAQQGENVDYAMVLVTVGDINDFSPSFTQQKYDFSVLEGNYSTSYVVDSVQAIDLDAGNNSLIKYSIKDSGEDSVPFLIAPNLGIIRLYGVMDHEQKDQYNFIVVAQDGGYPPLSAEVPVTITVIDVNDNAPVFVDPPLLVNLFDDLALGSNVTQVRAEDLDSGVYGQVLYSLLTHTDVFDVQSSNGLVRLLSPLNALFTNQYFLVIEAHDLAPGTNRLRSETNITINVMPAGQDKPLFPDDVYNVQVLPKIETGVPFLQLSAGVVGQLTYELSSLSSIDPLFSIEQNTGKLTMVREPLWNETGRTHEITVTATNVTSLDTDTTTVRIFVISRSTGPVIGEKLFPQSQYWVDFNENVEGKSLLIDLNSTYESKGVTYQLVSNESTITDNFEIDNNGQLFVLHSLDREFKSHYFLKINVTGRERVKRQTNVFPSQLTLNDYFKVGDNECLVVVNVTDTNDNGPAFDQENYVFTIGPTTASGTLIDRIAASDVDITDTLTYSIKQISDADDSEKFRIDSLTGDLFAHINFVSTNQAEFIIRVQATDGTYDDVTNVKIYKWTQDKLVVLVSNKPERNIRHAMTDLALKMSQLTGWNVSVNGVTSHINQDDTVNNDKSDIYVYAIDPATRKPVPGEILASRLREVIANLRQDQYLVTLNLQETIRPAASSRSQLQVSTAEIILIVICCIIIFVALIGVLFAFKWCASRDRGSKVSNEYMNDTQSGGPRPYDTDTLDRKTAASLFSNQQFSLNGSQAVLNGPEANAGQDIYIASNSYASSASLMGRAPLPLYFATANRLPYYHNTGPPSPPRLLPLRPVSPMTQRATITRTVKL